MDRLPDELLSAVLEHAGVAEGPSVILVSKRWQRLFFAAPGLWRQFVIGNPNFWAWSEERAQRAAARGALLARVAAMVESLEVNQCDQLERLDGGGQLARVMRCLRPAVARSVCLNGAYAGRAAPTDAVAALAGLTLLTSLQLSGCELPPHTTSVLRQLSGSLHSLSLGAREISPVLVAPLLLLPHLTGLHLGSVEPLPRFDWRRLSALAQLQSLSLEEEQTNGDEDEQLQPPPPAAFGALTDFSYFTMNDTFQLAGAEMRRVACEQLWGPDEDEEDRVHGRAAHALTLERVQRLDSLRTVLDALLTPRMPLRDLTIVATTPVPAATVRGCEQHFSGLTALAFYPHDSPGPGGANSTEALQALQALLEQAPRAVKLRVGLENECGALPTFLASRPWRVLHLDGFGLTDLPEGPYLTGLESLSLTEPALSCLPTALALATALTSLELWRSTAVGLATADEWKARLPPHLRRLGLLSCGLTDLPAVSQLSGLTSLDLSSNAFTQLPAVLEAATALVSLDLAHCKPLECITADVDRLAASLPNLCLRRLRLPGISTLH